MIYISDSVVLSSALLAQGITGNNPRIGWHNLVTQNNVFADEEDTDHPVSYMGNPATYLYWRGETTSAQVAGFSLSSAQTVNYIALARHNLGTIGAQIQLESSTDGGNWDPMTDPQILPNDNSLIREFDDTFASHFRVSIGAGSAAPEIGVMYSGEMLRLQRRMYVGHTPLVYGRQSDVSTSFSEEGHFLGRVVRKRMYKSSVSMENITADFYRDEIDPFFHEAVEKPFFIAWRPLSYPSETGYVWLTADPSMSNRRANGMVGIDFQFQGIR
jgi:hypothetical protein